MPDRPGSSAAVPARVRALAALALLVPASQIAWSGVPRPWAPYPMLLVLPMFARVPWWVPGTILVALFLATVWVVLRIDEPPWFIALPAGAVALLNLLYVVLSWEHGVKYQGLAHVVLVVMLALVVPATWSVLFALAGRGGPKRLVFWGTWTVFFWLAWQSFPYLGEVL